MTVVENNMTHMIKHIMANKGTYFIDVNQNLAYFNLWKMEK